MLHRITFAFVYLFGSVATGHGLPYQNITWFPCKEKTSLPLTCGSLIVPLDYINNSSSALMQLSMAKISASKQPKQGTILLNPGGPGNSGREFIAGRNGAALQAATGGVYDLIGFDPRCVHFIIAANDVFRLDVDSCIPCIGVVPHLSGSKY